jgi:heavy metal translocating P-type ATPase
MIPLAAAMLGGAAVAAGSYSFQKLKEFRKSGGVQRLSPAAEEFKGLVGDLRDIADGIYTEDLRPLRRAFRRQRRKLTVIIAHSATALKDEAQFVTVAVLEGAGGTIQHLATSEIDLEKTLRSEWRAFREVVSEDAGLFGDVAHRAGEFIGDAAKLFGPSSAAATPAGAKPATMGPRAVWRSLRQAKELVFDDSRSRQLDEFNGPAEGSARSQIAVAEQSVERYLKVAASSVAVAAVGTLFFPPLKLVSGAMILYAAFPVFKGAYTDIVVNRRISIRLLDSVSFIGLLAGGYFLICSITSTIFHASTKLMLKTEDRSRALLANMFGQQPQSVRVLVDGKELEIPFELLTTGDTLVVHAGQMIPVDGVIRQGTAAVDQRILTGEAQPAEKGPGDDVFAATVLLAGRIEVRVEKTGKETAAAQIREVLANTTDFRSAIQARWRGVADQTVLPTLGLAGVALAILNPASALAVINSNYVAVMKVASPLGMLNFLQRASQAGVLIKDGRALEATSKVDTVIFDKTGTLTENQPHIGKIHVFADRAEEDILKYAAAVEANQSHPIAKAILEAASARKLALPPLDDARYEVGYGIEARIGEEFVRVGSARYMGMEGITVPAEFQTDREAMQSRGSSIVYVGIVDRLAGAIELRPTLRPEAKEVVRRLKDFGLTLYIISGDQAAPTEALATELGIAQYFAEVLPQDKSHMVEKLQKEGRKVCFVGDGINDAIALKTANVSVSLRGASSLATNTAQIILMDETLRQLSQLFQVAREYDANLKTLMTTTFVPGLASLACVFFLGTGNALALTLFNASMIAGLVNAIWPALQNLDEPDATSLARARPESEASPLSQPIE